jgi:hypothetical protein
MKKILIFSSLSVLSLCFTACKKSDDKNLENISYGTSFNMCVGYCHNELTVYGNKATMTRLNARDAKATKKCESSIDENEFEEIKKLLATDEVYKLPKSIGCPDCADGGAEWVAFKIDGKEYKTTYEYGNVPEPLKAAVDKLKAIRASFEGCK